MTKRSAVRAAKARGLITSDVARRAAPVRHRRVCPMCGQKFVPDNPHRFFCNCGCCAAAWGKLYDAERASPPEIEAQGFRWMRAGDRVIVLETGQSAVLVNVSEAGRFGEATIEIDGELIHVGPQEVERVLNRNVTHVCGKGRNPFAVAKKGAENHGRDGEEAA